MDVSIIIVNYNTHQITSECIASVFEQTKELSFEIILIDNASTDGSKESFQNDKRITYIYNEKNVGFGRANNQGMNLAHGEYLFLLNNDTLLKNNAIKILYDYAETHEKEAFYGCWLENQEGKFIHSCSRLPSIRLLLAYTLRLYGHKLNKNIVTEVDEIRHTDTISTPVGFVSGADLFLHRKVYDKTKGFDTGYFMYYEESDWQHRAHDLGINSFVINGPRIIHLEGASQVAGNNHKKQSLKISTFAIRIQSRLYYVKKFYPCYYYFLFRIAYALLMLPVVFLGSDCSKKDIKPALITLFS